MFKSRNVLVATLMVLTWFGCAPGPDPEPEPEPAAEGPADDEAAVRDAIDAVREREIAAFAAGDVDGLMEIFSSDCIIMPPDAPAVTGAEEIRAWIESTVSQFDLAGSYGSTELDIKGDWAIEVLEGELSFTPKSGGETLTQPIKGLHIYERQPDGSWQIQYDVWNSAPPPAA